MPRQQSKGQEAFRERLYFSRAGHGQDAGPKGKAMQSVDSFNWSAVSAVVSVLTLVGTVGVGGMMWGSLTERVKNLTKRVDDHRSELDEHEKRMNSSDTGSGWPETMERDLQRRTERGQGTSESSLAQQRMPGPSSVGNEQVDQPDAKDHCDDHLSDTGERWGQRDKADDPPDQAEDQAHHENRNQDGEHDSTSRQA